MHSKQITSRYIEDRRPPPHIRPELDLGFRVIGQSIEIFEIHPIWRGDPKEKIKICVAKAASTVKHRAL